METVRVPKKKKWWVPPFLTMMVGGLVSLASFVLVFGALFASLLNVKDLDGPGTHSVVVEKGEQTIYQRVGTKSSTSVGPVNVNSSFLGPSSLGSSDFAVTSASGESLDIRPTTMSETLTVNERIYVGVARFTAPAKGTYTLEVRSEGTVVINRSIGGIFSKNWGTILLAFVAGLVALAGLIWFIVRAVRRNKSTAPSVAPYFLPKTPHQ